MRFSSGRPKLYLRQVVRSPFHRIAVLRIPRLMTSHRHSEPPDPCKNLWGLEMISLRCLKTEKQKVMRMILPSEFKTAFRSKEEKPILCENKLKIFTIIWRNRVGKQRPRWKAEWVKIFLEDKDNSFSLLESWRISSNPNKTISSTLL